jgi:hypothetical protein
MLKDCHEGFGLGMLSGANNVLVTFRVGTK